MKLETIEFINKLLDDIHNVEPELCEKRSKEFNKLLSGNYVRNTTDN